jgi:spore germination protein GerM
VIRRVGALVTALAVLSACSVGPEDDASTIDAAEVPFDLLNPEAPAVVPVVDGRTARVCLFRSDALEVVDREVEQSADLRDVVASLAGVTDEEAAAGFESAVTAGEEILGVETAAGVAAVDLAPSASGSLTQDPLATIAQLVCTLTQQRGVGAVRFTVDGVPIDVPVANGSLTEGPVSRDDYASLLREP